MIKPLVAFFTRRLVNKLILLFTAIIILVVGSLTFISYKNMEQESVRHSIASNTNNLKLVHKNLENYFAEIDQFTLPQIRYDAVMNAIENEPGNFTAMVYLEDYLRELYYARSDIEGIFLYLIGQRKYYYISREGQNIGVKQKLDEQIPKQDWFAQALSSKDNKFIQSLLFPQDTGYAFDEKNSFMVVHRTLRKLVDRQPKAIVSFFFNTKAIDQIIAGIPVSSGEHVIFLNSDRVPFYADDKQFYNLAGKLDLFHRIQQANDEGRLTWENNGEKFLVFHTAGETNKWELVKPVPYNEIYRAARANRDVSILIGFVFLLISFLFVTLVSNAITRPLKKLSRRMDRFSEGNFELEAAVAGRDEIASLARHFNAMVRKTNELINERYKMKLVEKNAILKALEAEINPHFLYNALQAISTKALKNGMDDLAGMVDSLALTLRYCISGADMVQIREEIRHIERYLILQKARFGSRLLIEYEIDKLVYDVLIPKLTIQSLVENSIKHALEKVSYTTVIAIKAQLDDAHAVITVEDNGPGIPEARLKQILRSFAVEWEEREHDSIGLKNLHDRLKLIYGDAAKLTISASEPGVMMQVKIPAGGGIQNVQRAHY